MTDIETKAREYAEEQISGMEFTNDYERTCELTNHKIDFLAGAAYALGNQWRDASKELPEDMQEVIIAYIAEDCERDDEILTKQATFRNGQYVYILDGLPNLAIPKKRVLAWLPIPEYKPNGE